MGWGRIFKALREVFSGARVRGQALSSPEDYFREIQRLQRELEIVRAKREKEKAEFHARHTILNTVPQEGDMPLAEVDRRLTNLHRIRDNRFQAEELAYERQIRELEEQVRKRFGHE
ncbi:MAG: hypothetical protein ACE5MG_04140 [Candidatus Methylomirabilales bacterium]